MTIANLRQRKAFLPVVGIFLLGFSLLTILPWSASGYGFDLDQSWAIALHVAFANRFQFGTEFIYTYGPYGFVQVDIYHPASYAYLFALRCLIAVAVAVGLFKLARGCLVRRRGAVWFLVPVLLFFPNVAAWMEYFQYIVIILPLVLYFYDSKRLSPALVLTISTLALATLVKHTYLLLGVFFILLIAIDELFKLKRFPLVATVYLVLVWLWWTIAGQELANVPAYLTNSLQIVRGFSQALGIAGKLDELLLYILGTGLFLLLVCLVEWRSRRWWGMLPTLGLSAVFFITFKGSFTRHDSHALQAFFNIIPIVLIFTAMLWQQIGQYYWRIGKSKLTGTVFWSFALIILLSMSFMIQQRYLSFESGGYVTNAVRSLGHKISPAINLITGNTDFEANVALNKSQVQKSNDLPPTSGTVDLYPNETASIFAYDLPYQPRPVFQSFSAYTKKLARLNAEHLTSPDAADSILFDLNPIDGHLASFEDGLSWSELLTRYDITNLEGRYLLLERSPQPRKYNLEPLDRQTVALGQWYEMPSSTEPVWAELNLQPNLWGKLMAGALRLPDLYLEIETLDGVKVKYRAIPDILDVGFLLSPVLSSRWDFLALATPDWQQRLATQQVRRFRIVDEDINLLYPPEYEVALSQLQFDRQDFESVIAWQEWNQQLTPALLAGTLQRIAFDSQQFIWLAHAPTKSTIKLRGDERQLSFKFGVLDEAVEGALQQNVGDGVEFRIINEHNGAVLFSRYLQPMKNQSDRGLQQASIDLSQVDTKQLILETVSGQDSQWDWSYWSEIEAK